ncbi:MAG: NB-ARC domain-containing protein, partial [Bacteroidota bacterium]
QVALRLFHQQAAQGTYDHAFWIPAGSKEKLTSAYLGIANDLGIYIDKKNIAQTVQHVRRRLQDKHCLYVFDDAPSSQAIADFMPLKQGHVLITSRNSAAGSWTKEVQQQLLTPFGQEEVLALAQQFNCSLEAQDTATLQYLVENMSGYPLTLAQFFSFCQTQGYTPEAYVKQLARSTLTQQDEELLRLLAEAPEGRVRYNQSMLQVLRTSLQKLAKARKGAQATELLSKLAYLDPKSIPVDWILTFFPEDKSLLKRETRHMLALLERYSFIQWDRETGQVYMHAVTQRVVKHLHPYKALQELVDSLVAYAGDWEAAHERRQAWDCVLQHGTRLVRYLQEAQDMESLYSLTRALGKACDVACLYQEALSWRQKNLALLVQGSSGLCLIGLV